MKNAIAAFLLTIASSSAFSTPCRIGDSDKLNGSAVGIIGGSRTVTLQHGTEIEFLDVPGGLNVNYEVAAITPSAPTLLGRTTSFIECQGASCRIGAIVTLLNDADGIRSGTQLVRLKAGTRVRILEVAMNYEVVVLEKLGPILLGASTRFQTCGR